MTPRSTLQRLPDVLAARGLKRSKHYLDIEHGLWTPPITLGTNFSAWPSYETDLLIAAYASGASPEEIKSLVQKLVSDRKNRRAAISSAAAALSTPEMQEALRHVGAPLAAIISHVAGEALGNGPSSAALAALNAAYQR